MELIRPFIEALLDSSFPYLMGLILDIDCLSIRLIFCQWAVPFVTAHLIFRMVGCNICPYLWTLLSVESFFLLPLVDTFIEARVRMTVVLLKSIFN
jgi:hypothetical protein